MSFPLITLMVAVGAVLWLARRIPLGGLRRFVVIAGRVAAVSGLCAALWGVTYRRTHAVPRQVVYLVDGSASIDAAQRAWIARRVASLESLRPSPMERALVVFGADAQIVVPFGGEPLTDPSTIQRLLDEAPIEPGRTNVEQALLLAASLLSPGRGASLVLFSDGRETAGNAAQLFSYLRRSGVAVYPSPPPTSGRLTTVWEDLVVPASVQRGSPVAVRLVVHNRDPQAKRGEVLVSLRDVAIRRQPVIVRPGWQVVTVSVPSLQRGTMALTVTLSLPEQRFLEERSAYTEVEGPAQLLLVTEAGAVPMVGRALERRQVDVALSRPADLSQDPTKLLDYDAVMLFNVPKSSLSAAQVQGLRTYLERFGGGLVTVGLGGDFAQELNTPSPIDPLLPVVFEPKGLQEATRRVCMVMLIDRSASMMGPRLAATKRAAVELVNQLAAEDLVGVLAFDTRPYVVVEVQQAGQVGRWLIDKLVTLRSSGGTDVLPALKAAANRLELTGAQVKHIILLSDGNTPVNEQAYRELLESFRRDGVTVSAIGIGSVFINEDYLRWLSNSTGGTFYQMQRLDELPQLVARDTHGALGRLPFTEGYFRAAKTPTTDWFAEVPEFPPLRGFFTTTAQPGARVDLTVTSGEETPPLLARWSLGQGRVVTFTSDANTRWSPEWIRWSAFEGTWAQIVRWAMRLRPTEELFVWTDTSGATPQLMLEGELHDPKGELAGASGGASKPLALIQTGPWRWRAPLEELPSGWYQLILQSGEATSRAVATRWVKVGAPPTTLERAGQPPREDVLRHTARATGGTYDTPDAALLPPTARATTTVPLFTMWLPLVILALLIDVALRGPTML